MSWELYWTIFAQIAIAFPFVLAQGYFIRHLWFSRRKPVTDEELNVVADQVLDRIVVIGRDESAG